MSDDERQHQHHDLVAGLLGQAGLSVPEDEVARLAALYPGLRRQVDAFHAIDCGDDVTAAVYRAADDAAPIGNGGGGR